MSPLSGGRGGRTPTRSAKRGAHASPSRAFVALSCFAVVCLIAAGVAGSLLWASRGDPESGSAEQVPPPVFASEFGATAGPGLGQPVGIAAADGRVYVADAANGVVAVYTVTGSFVATLGADALSTPVYVALNPLDGRLYVTDRQAKAIQVIGLDGRFVRTFEPSDAAGKAAVAGWQPLAIAFGDNGSLYVSDVGARQRVLAFGPTGALVAQTGADIPPGASGKQLSFANGLAVVGDRLIVADSNNSRVLVLDERLRFVRASSFAGLPRGATPLRDDLFMVVDTTGSELRIMNRDAATLARVSSKGQQRGQMLLPTAVASDATGRVFVSDTGNHRVSVWTVSGVVRRDLLTAAVSDPRWWAVAIAATAGIAAAIAASLVRTKTRQAI